MSFLILFFLFFSPFFPPFSPPFVVHGWVTSYLEFAKEIISISLRKKISYVIYLFLNGR
jgi:uncharacterized membrane protein YbaN (DUF454 family)